MSPRAISRTGAALAALVAFAAGCSDAAPPVAPPAPSLPAPTTPPIDTSAGFPPAPGTVQLYVSTPAVDAAYSAYPGVNGTSRFVLDADGTFRLQIGSGEYHGRYTVTDAAVTFAWDGWSSAGPWGATGTLRGDTLHVAYNVVMQLTDFVDGDYVRLRAAP